MTSDTPDPSANAEKAKRDYWNELIAANDPDAVARHDAFCTKIDKILQLASEGGDAVDQAFELTRQAMMNIVIAHHQGDEEEIARLQSEFEKQLKALGSSG